MARRDCPAGGKKGPPQTRLSEQAITGSELELPLVKRLAAVRSQSASRITWHSHEAFEVLFLLDGATSYQFADGRLVELPGEHFLVIPPGVKHRGLHDVRQPVRLCGIMFDPVPRSALRHTPFSLDDLKRLHAQFERGAFCACRMSSDLCRRVKWLLEHLDSDSEHGEFVVVALRLAVCMTLVEAARQLADPRSLGPNLAVKVALAFMEAHLAQPISMDSVAYAAHCSRARLFSIFKESTGMTPNDYMQRLRVQRAQQALTDTAASITDIALNCGFSTSQYFSSVFRKYTGTTPSEFRTRSR